MALLLLLPSLAAAQGLTRYPPAGGPPARTNGLARSNGMTTGTSVVSPWVLQSVTVTTVAGAPAYAGGGTWAQITNTINNNAMYQPATLPASKVFTGSVWMAKASGSGPASFSVYCGNVPSSCTCSGGGCVASIANADRCLAKIAALGTTPVRVSITATCGAIVATPYLNLFGGEYGVSNGTTRYTGAQLEVKTTASPICVTTTAARTCRN